MTKVAAVVSLMRKDADSDRLALSTRPRSSAGPTDRICVPVAHPDRDPEPSEHTNSEWQAPHEAGNSIRFQGAKGGENRLAELNLMKGVCEGRAVGTITEPRVVATIPLGVHDTVGKKASRQALTQTVLQERRRLGNVTIGELKEKTKEAMEKTNFSMSASISRLALTKGNDPALLCVNCGHHCFFALL